MDHPNILKIFEVYEDATCLHLVTELCSGGELFDRILEKGRLTEEDAAHYIKQILLALNYMHGREITHGNLTLQTIFLEKEDRKTTVKLVGFGNQ
jgi:calcium-dependent protein kinase